MSKNINRKHTQNTMGVLFCQINTYTLSKATNCIVSIFPELTIKAGMVTPILFTMSVLS